MGVNSPLPFDFRDDQLRDSERPPLATTHAGCPRGEPRLVGLLTRLPPRFAVIPAGPAIVITFVPTATATASSAVTTAAAAVATSAATATVAAAVSATTTAVATSAFSSGTSFVNRQIAAVEVLAVKLFDGRSRFFRSRHLDKAETSRATRHAIFYDLSRFNVTRLGKVLAQIIAGRLEREISHVEFCSHFYFLKC